MELALFAGVVILAESKYVRFWRGLTEGDPIAWVILFGVIAFITVPPLWRWLRRSR